MGGFNISLGERIREARRNSDLTQIQLADLINVNQAVVSYWENGKTVPTLENVIAISKELDISLDWLVLGRSTPTSQPEYGPILKSITFKLKDLPETDQLFAEQLIDRLLGRGRGGTTIPARKIDAG